MYVQTFISIYLFFILFSSQFQLHQSRLQQRLAVLDNVAKEVAENQQTTLEARHVIEQEIQRRVNMATEWIQKSGKAALEELETTIGQVGVVHKSCLLSPSPTLFLAMHARIQHTCTHTTHTHTTHTHAYNTNARIQHSRTHTTHMYANGIVSRALCNQNTK